MPFSDLIMKPVENVNIVDKNAVTIQTFPSEKNEEELEIDVDGFINIIGSHECSPKLSLAFQL